MAEGTATPTGFPFVGGLRRPRSYETLRTPLDLRNAIVRAALRDAGIDPDRLAEMTPSQQAHILAQVQELGRHTGEMRTAAERRLAEDWRRMREERDGPANDRTSSGPVTGVGTDLARTLLGADFSSGVSAAFLQWAQANYSETYTLYSGEAFRTTAERAEMYRGLQDAYSTAPPADRTRVEGIVRRSEEFFRRRDQERADGQPPSPGTVRAGVDAGLAIVGEQRTHAEAIALAQARIRNGEDINTVLTELGLNNRFRQLQALHALMSEIQRQLPGDTPEAVQRREDIGRRLRELERRFLDAGRDPTARLAILGELRTFLDATNVANEQELLARLDSIIARTQRWEARQRRTTEIRARLTELLSTVQTADGDEKETALQELARLHRELSERITELEANRPGDTPEQTARRQRALADDRQLRDRVVQALTDANRPGLIGAPPSPGPLATPTPGAGPRVLDRQLSGVVESSS